MDFVLLFNTHIIFVKIHIRSADKGYSCTHYMVKWQEGMLILAFKISPQTQQFPKETQLGSDLDDRNLHKVDFTRSGKLTMDILYNHDFIGVYCLMSQGKSASQCLGPSVPSSFLSYKKKRKKKIVIILR